MNENRSRRDRFRRRREEGSLEDRKKGICRIVSWEGDNVAEGLQAGAEEDKKAWCQVTRDWIGHQHNQKAKNLKTLIVNP